MNGCDSCSNLIYLSTVACKLGECLTEEELLVLSADLVVLGDLLANIVARKSACAKVKQQENE